MTTNNLTEQWKKGELELGKYYIKTIYSGVVEDTHIRTKVGRVWNNYQDDEIIEVLAPVPSYDEWQSLNELLDSMQDTNKVLAHRLNMLKELLKECCKMLAQYHIENSEPSLGENIQLLTKIDEVLK